MASAEFKINKSSLLVEACNLINDLNISAQNQDVQGDLYEYLLSKLSTAGTNGQFRTPRHIIRMMVKMTDPKKHERIGDLAAGTCGFLVRAYEHILESNTSPDLLEYDAAGEAHGASGDLLEEETKERRQSLDLLEEGDRSFLQKQALRGFDSDSGMAMLRIGSMNLMLHGLENPQFFYQDSLSKGYTEKNTFDVLLMNPSFKGAVDKGDVHPDLPGNVKKTELLFIHLMLRMLKNGGRAAVIVPDGVLFGSSKAHQELRKNLLESHKLEGVISMPGGVFKPYDGVSTAVLLFTKGGRTERVWFYDMAQDGFSLDDKRNPTPQQNDIPDILESWKRRSDPEYARTRAERIEALRIQLEPLEKAHLNLQAELSRLTFESAIAPESETEARASLETLQADLSTIEAQMLPLFLFWKIAEDIYKKGGFHGDQVLLERLHSYTTPFLNTLALTFSHLGGPLSMGVLSQRCCCVSAGQRSSSCCLWAARSPLTYWSSWWFSDSALICGFRWPQNLTSVSLVDTRWDRQPWPPPSSA